MKLSNNTILITGGATGIGLAFAEQFLQEGNEVIVVGRREEKLKEAKKGSRGYIRKSVMYQRKKTVSNFMNGF